MQLNNRLSNKIAVTVVSLITGDMLLISTKKTIKLSLWFSIHLQFADEFWGLILCSLVCASQSATATTHQKLYLLMKIQGPQTQGQRDVQSLLRKADSS